MVSQDIFFKNCPKTITLSEYTNRGYFKRGRGKYFNERDRREANMSDVNEEKSEEDMSEILPVNTEMDKVYRDSISIRQK